MNLLFSNRLANLPVSWAEQNFTFESSGVNWQSLLVLGDASLAREGPRPQNSTCLGRYPG